MHFCVIAVAAGIFCDTIRDIIKIIRSHQRGLTFHITAWIGIRRMRA